MLPPICHVRERRVEYFFLVLFSFSPHCVVCWGQCYETSLSSKLSDVLINGWKFAGSSYLLHFSNFELLDKSTLGNYREHSMQVGGRITARLVSGLARQELTKLLLFACGEAVESKLVKLEISGQSNKHFFFVKCFY